MSQPKRVIISLVTWNSSRYLDALFASLAAQTYQHCELLIVDNASIDDTVPLIAEWIPKFPFPVTLTRQETNTGFAAAHNRNIHAAVDRRASAVLVVNPDIILEAHYIELALHIFEEHPEVGVVGGKLLRMDFSKRDDALHVDESSLIDSTGILMKHSRHNIDRGRGEHDRGQYNEGEVFGISGALALYRVRALVDIAVPVNDERREYYDEDFFAYDEDVDLAWRLQWRGWSAWYCPMASAWHRRTLSGSRRRAASAVVRGLSWRNHLFVLLKEETWGTMRFALPLICFRECAKILWIGAFERSLLRECSSLLRLWKRMRQKRMWIQQRRKRTSAAMRAVLFAP